MSLSEFWRAVILDYYFDGVNVYYAGLSTADPLADGSGLAEPGDTYVRVGTDAWSRVANEVDNDVTIEFPEATGAWGTVTYLCLFDALEGGNLLGSAALDDSRDITAGVTPRFLAGEFNVTLT